MVKTSLNIRDLVEAVELLQYAEKKGAFSDLAIVANKSQEIREKFTAIVNEFVAMQQQQTPQEMTKEEPVVETPVEKPAEEKTRKSSKKRKAK